MVGEFIGDGDLGITFITADDSSPLSRIHPATIERPLPPLHDLLPPHSPLSLSPPLSPDPHPDKDTPGSNPSSSQGDYEDELSAAMPLLATGELPPTWQGSGPSSPTQKSPSLVFAAGVSAQYVAPSVDDRQSRLSREQQTNQARDGRSTSLPLNLCQLGRNQQQKTSSPKGLAFFAPLNSSSLSNLLLPSRSRSNSKGKKSKKSVDRKCWDEAVSRRDFDDPEDELSPAMPLLSLDPEKGERNFEGALGVKEEPRKFQRNLSVPLSSSFNESETSMMEPTWKTMPDMQKTFVLRKVHSSQNLASDTPAARESAPPIPLQLSAIPNRVRARIMSEEDLHMPRNRSSSLSDISPLAKTHSFDVETSDVSTPAVRPEPITVVYSKPSSAINQASFFVNPSSSNLSSISLDAEDTAATKAQSTASFRSNSSTPPHLPSSPSPVSPTANHGWMLWDSPVVINQSVNNRGGSMAETKAMHVSLPSLSNLSNDSNRHSFSSNINSVCSSAHLTRVSSECSISLAKLTNVASHFVAGASVSKPSPPNHPRIPFSSNPLTPTSSSSHISPTVGLCASSSSGSLPVSEDRYAALKDLDEAFKVQKDIEKPSGGSCFDHFPLRTRRSSFVKGVST